MAHTRKDLERMQDEVRNLRRQSRQNLQMVEDMLRQRGVDIEAELARFLALPTATQKAAVAEFSGRVAEHPLWGLSPADLPDLSAMTASIAPIDPPAEDGSEPNAHPAPDLTSLRHRLQRLTTQRI